MNNNNTQNEDKNYLIGQYDGEKLILDNGEIMDVARNYAVKSRIMEGDRLKAFTNEDGEVRFKIVEKVKRKKVKGKVVTHNGKIMILTELGLRSLVQEAIDYYSLSEGDELIVIVSEDLRYNTYCAVDKTLKQGNSKDEQGDLNTKELDSAQNHKGSKEKINAKEGVENTNSKNSNHINKKVNDELGELTDEDLR